MAKRGLNLHFEKRACFHKYDQYANIEMYGKSNKQIKQIPAYKQGSASANVWITYI